jgi:hypothetical protein
MPRKLQLVAGILIGLAAAAPAMGQAPAAPAADRETRRQQIDLALAQQQKRREEAWRGMVTGAVVFGAGVVVSVIRTVDNAKQAEDEAYENGESEYEYDVDYTGTLIGALLALPIVLVNQSKLADADKRARELTQERYQLGLAPGAHGATMLTLRFDF